MRAQICAQGITYVPPTSQNSRFSRLTITQKKAQTTDEQDDASWKKKYGEESAKIIRETVDENIEHYEYLKQFAIKV